MTKGAKRDIMSKKEPPKHRTERVKLLVANFHRDFVDGGLTIAEIEKKYHVSKGYAYGLLDEIAENNGVTAETYYQMEHGPHICIGRDGRLIPNKNVSFTDIRSNLSTASDALNQASAHLENLSKTIEQEIELDPKESEGTL